MLELTALHEGMIIRVVSNFGVGPVVRGVVQDVDLLEGKVYYWRLHYSNGPRQCWAYLDQIQHEVRHC